MRSYKSYKCKSGTFKNIPIRCLKEVSDKCSPFLAQIWSHEMINQKSVPANLQLADVNSVIKKKDSNLAENYRSLSVLFRVPKVFEKLV